MVAPGLGNVLEFNIRGQAEAHLSSLGQNVLSQKIFPDGGDVLVLKREVPHLGFSRSSRSLAYRNCCDLGFVI